MLSGPEQHKAVLEVDDRVKVKEAARQIGMSEQFVRKEIQRGRLPRYKFGRSVRTSQRAVREYIRQAGR